MTSSAWPLHPKALTELRAAAEWYEERAADLGEEFIAHFERHVDAASWHAHPGTSVPYVRRPDVRWLLLTPRFPYGIVLLLEPRAVIAVAHLHRKPASRWGWR
jgi:hypothetical protein